MIGSSWFVETFLPLAGNVGGEEGLMETMTWVLLVAALAGGMFKAFINGTIVQRQTWGDVVICGVAGGVYSGFAPADVSLVHAGLIMFAIAYLASDSLVTGLTKLVQRYTGPLIPPRPVFVMPLAIALLAGCATVQQDIAKAQADLSTFTQADLDRAIAMATVAKDAEAPYRARCYTTLKKYVPDGSTVGQALLPNGAISAFEKVAELDQQARAGLGLPQDLRADCSILLISAQEFALRLGVKFAPIPGGAAVGGIVR